MTEIRCVVFNNKGVQCSSVFTTKEVVGPKAKFICKNHNRAEQVRANDRIYDPTKDEADKDLHFQDFQFDDKLSGGHI